VIAVIDASVALKWQFEDEEASNAAIIFLEDFINGRIDLISPTLFPYEILNAINVAINRKRIKEEAGYKAINYIKSLGIELRNLDDLMGTVFNRARQYGLSPYDCAYIVLAEREKCEFFTGDKKLFNSMKNRLAWIKWIGDYCSSF
jgi:predicted nucleic acid-binding protein